MRRTQDRAVAGRREACGSVSPCSSRLAWTAALVKALARAFRWRDMLEDGQYATIREIAEAEKITESYVGRILRLTLLAP